MFLVMASAFVGSFLGAFLGDLMSRYMFRDLNSEEKNTTIIDGIVRPRGSKPTKKRTPKVLTDLMAYQAEIKEEGENRG